MKQEGVSMEKSEIEKKKRKEKKKRTNCDLK